MYAVTFETDIVSEFLRIPHFEKLKNKHVRVVIEAEADETAVNPKQAIKALLASAQQEPFQQIQDPLVWQATQRDEWV